jgi:hypothetical protein
MGEKIFQAVRKREAIKSKEIGLKIVQNAEKFLK